MNWYLLSQFTESVEQDDVAEQELLRHLSIKLVVSFKAHTNFQIVY